MKSAKTIYVERVDVGESDEETIFSISCRLVSGALEVGDFLKLSYSSGIDMTIPVDRIVEERGDYVVIGVVCNDASEADFLVGLDLSGESIEVLSREEGQLGHS